MMGRTIHLPSSFDNAESSSQSSQGQDGIGHKTPRERAMGLIKRKDDIQGELDAYFEVLTSHNADMSTQLVDNEGFPRADIDVAAIRTARAAIIRLRNDLSQVYDEIQIVLQQVYARPDEQGNGNGVPMDEDTPAEESRQEHVPFAVITGVAPNSPAWDSGLKREDKVVKFGNLDHTNNQRLTALPGLISNSENVPLPLIIQRSTETTTEIINLELTPKSGWGGRGLLGCHVVPL